MNSKEIWFVDQYIGHPKYGNVYRNFYISKELTKKGYNVKIFAPSYSHLMYSTPKTNGLLTQEIIDGIEFNWIKVRHYKSGKSIGRVISIFEFTLKLFILRKFAAPDFIITPSVSFLPYWTVSFLKRWKWASRPKIILEIRDLWPLSLIVLGKNKLTNPFIKLLSITEKHAYKNVDYIISTLKMCSQHIDNVIQQPYKFKWIDNGINILEKQEKLSVPNEVIELVPKNKFLIGYTGALGVANAMNYFIDAARLLSHKTEFHFIVVGDGYEKENLMKSAEGLNNITFIPKINKLLIPSLLECFNLLYFSYSNVPELYKYGVSANKTYEYMISGKPILLSAPKMEYNIISEAQCGIVINPEDASEIIDGIDKIYRMSANEQENMGIRGREYIMQNNTFDILANRLVRVFDELNTNI